jgi:hypothetical protein
LQTQNALLHLTHNPNRPPRSLHHGSAAARTAQRLAAWPLGRLAAWPLGRLAAWPPLTRPFLGFPPRYFKAALTRKFFI